MAACALSLAEKDILPTQFGCGCLSGIQLAVPSKLGRRRKVKNILKFRHGMHLASTLKRIYTLLRRDHLVAVKVGGSLFELRKVLNRLQGPLRTEEALNVYAAQGRRLDAMSKLLWPYISDQMEGAIGAPIGMAVQARNPAARLLRAPVDRLIELLLRQRRSEERRVGEEC